MSDDDAVWNLVVHERDGDVVLLASGELDLDSAPRLLAEVVRVLGAGATSVIIDLAGLTFVDSSGLGTLVGCWRRARAAKVPLTVANPTDDVAMTLEITGLDQILPIQRDDGQIRV